MFPRRSCPGRPCAALAATAPHPAARRAILHAEAARPNRARPPTLRDGVRFDEFPVIRAEKRVNPPAFAPVFAPPLAPQPTATAAVPAVLHARSRRETNAPRWR